MSNVSRTEYRKPVTEIITDLINRANPGRNFHATDLTFGVPEVATILGGDTTTQNTNLKVTVNSTEVTYDINYGRMDLAQRVGLAGAQIIYEDEVSVSELMDKINEAGGFMLTTDDDLLNTEVTGPGPLILRARTGSLFCIGQVEVTLVEAAEVEPDPEPETPDLPLPKIKWEMNAGTVTPGAVNSNTYRVGFNIDIEEDTTQSPQRFEVDFGESGFIAASTVSEGFNLLSSPGSSSAIIFMREGIIPGTYVVAFDVAAAADADSIEINATYRPGEEDEESAELVIDIPKPAEDESDDEGDDESTDPEDPQDPEEEEPSDPQAPVNEEAPSIAYNIFDPEDPDSNYVFTATAGTWSGDEPITLTYQWLRDGEEIEGATGTTYQTVEDDVGTEISVVETATNDAGSESEESNVIEFDPDAAE